MKDLRDRIRAVGEAKEALSKSLGVLVLSNNRVGREAIAQAVFFASLALIRLADADDEDESGRVLLEKLLANEKARRAAESPV